MHDDQLKVFCVECNAWWPVAIHSLSNVLLKQTGRTAIRDLDQMFLCCQNCVENIEYLLNNEHKKYLSEKMQEFGL